MLALVFLIVNIATCINIVYLLKESGIKADLRWLRFKAYGYAKQYKDFTLEKEGNIGSLYYYFMTSSILFIRVLVMGIISAYLTK